MSKKVRILKMRKNGMFSNINEVIDQLYLAEQEGYEIFIDWSISCYRDNSREEDPWNYYFEPCGVDYCPPHSEELPVSAMRLENIITPRCNNMLMLPSNKFFVKKLINKYIKLKPEIKDKVESFIRKKFHGYIIGLHMRGPGKTDGGVKDRLDKIGLSYDVPFHLYFKELDKELSKSSDARIFMCSDSQFVIDTCRERYGDIIFTSDATRSKYGEMHCPISTAKLAKRGYPPDKGANYNMYELGVDILVDAFLLCETNVLIHGVSNVVNFVICNNPELPDINVFV